mmetsp:Transcript_38548/g.82247  ORF Transcript_38548/g.82247 Transcript_38548/m.82247 type:complete len:324 (-) Transcript_38548:361-1332(-)
MMRRPFRPILAISAAFLATITSQYHVTAEIETGKRRQLEIGSVGSDEMVDAVMAVKAEEGKPSLGIGANDHALITSILESTKELVETASRLVQNEGTLEVGQDMMEEANEKLREVREHIQKINSILRMEKEADERKLLRNKYKDHDVQKTQEDDTRALDVSRSMYETMVTFPECVERLFDHCVGLINRDLRKLGLNTVEMIVREKRNHNQESYNKVVIVTNELGDRVLGRSGDGIVEYPYLWNDAEQGERKLGVDGKWNCLNKTPEECCTDVKSSAPHPDENGKNIECHIFVPFGGVGNRRRSDRVFVILSSDGRVHEPPIVT